MAGLPENWEWDYDGNRWFYRYKPTGLIQYTFPKPGDEFPEFVDDSAPPPDLAPEEKLVSQQQIKRRSTLGQIPTRQSTATTHRERASSNAVSDPDDGSGPFWLQPDGLMYMGPGAYTDISPLQEEEEERGEESAKAGEEDVAGAPVPAPPTSVSNATESAGTPQPTRSQMSPIVSTETTPQVLNSNPATTTPELDSAVIIEVGESVAGDIGVVEQPEVHLLDGRQVPSNPIGFVAELASELTARCDDEINPAPVELPGNEQMMYTSDPGVYVNAFDLAPVELPSDESAAGPKIAGGTVEQKPLVPHASGQGQGEVQRLRSYQAAQELLKRPYEPVRQHSLPQPTSSANPGPTPGQYQPYNPVRHAVLGAAAANKYSIAETQHRQLAGDNKRHSLAGPVLSQPRPTEIPPALQAPQVPPKRPVDPSDIPPALQAPQVPSKRPLDGPDNGAYPTIVGAGGLPNTVSSLATSTNPSSLAHFPAVLQPARGRPIMRAQSPPLTQRASPARTYQPYKSYRDLQKDIDDTVQLLSQTEYGQGTTANPETSNPLRPQVSRTGTLPAHISALPFRTARPKLLHSAASDPVTMRNVQSRQPPPGEASASKPPGQDEVVPISQEYSAPLPPSSPDIPQPLKLSRKSLPPQNRVPTVASFSLPVTADPVSTFMDATPAPSNTPVLDTPANSTSSPEAAMHLGSSGVTGNTGGDAEQVGDTGNRKLPTASSPPHQGVELKRTKDTDQIVTSTGQQQATMQGPPEQPVASGFTVSAEPAALPAPHAAASRQHVPVTFDTSSQPAPSASSVVESTDEPPIATDSRIAPVLSNATPTSQSVTYPLVSLTDRQGAEANQEPARSTPVVVVQRTSQSVSSRAGFVNPDVVQSSSHVVIDYQPMVESSRQSSSQPSPTPPNDQSARAEVAPLLGTSSAPSPALGDKSCSSEPANDVDQAVTPPQPDPEQCGRRPTGRGIDPTTASSTVPAKPRPRPGPDHTEFVAAFRPAGPTGNRVICYIHL
ncbi:hypothetical protein N657DRAFT_682071 [Parathielavia appendiculata]|uniref:WW domain-containing protein n=1 Tax=Parathielavia appendiculata TaxID=2587402 RepID=A0AAN6Z1V1_9PEZI|nr:hypothetical protein N657DRAFT_682071 [Parathielavia appendiculata]